MKKIIYKKLKSDDLNELKSSQTLYVSEFRSLSEDPTFEIPSMWKYENLLRWIIKGDYLCNEDIKYLSTCLDTKAIICNKADDPRIPIIKRLNKVDKYKKIYTNVPHQSLDEFCLKNDLDINYKHSLFTKLNNKISQKKTVPQSLTPVWKELVSWSEIEEVIDEKTYILKRSEGSGGYTVFFPQNFNKAKIKVLYDNFNGKWFKEEIIIGETISIQLYNNNNETIVFAMVKQIIENLSEFTGGEIHNISFLNKFKFKDDVERIITSLNKLLDEYTGFWGIDLIMNKNAIYFIEANVRHTAITVPALIMNNCGLNKVMFKEDCHIDEENGMVLTTDRHWDTKDIIFI